MAVRAVVGTAAVIHLGPIGLVLPRWSWTEARPLVGFGARVQLLSLVGMTREQGLNLGIAWIAGVATLGVWNLAFRVLQVPTMVTTTAMRVAFPAVARLLETDRHPRAVIERGVASLAVTVGLVLVAIVGFAPALPVLIGDGWDDVPATLAWSGIGLLIYGPVYVMAAGYHYAIGDVGAVIRAALAQTATWFAVAFALVPELGAQGVGLGWIAAASVSTLMLARRTRERTGARLLRHLLPPVALAVAAGAAGWAVATPGSETFAYGIAGAVVGELTLVAGLALVSRSLLRDAYRLMTDAVRGTQA